MPLNSQSYHATHGDEHGGSGHSRDSDGQCVEGDVLQAVKHPNVVQYLGSTLRVDEDDPSIKRLYYVLEHSSSSLHQYVLSRKRVSLAQLKAWMMDVLRGLAGLHGHGYCHLDLKAENVLVFQRGNDADGMTLKLCDFGYAVKIPGSSGVEFAMKPRGSPMYVAPEVESGKCDASGRSDIFSYGMMFSEIIARWFERDRDDIVGGAPISASARATTASGRTVHEPLADFALRYGPENRADVVALACDKIGGLWPECAAVLLDCNRVAAADRPTAEQALQQLGLYPLIAARASDSDDSD